LTWFGDLSYSKLKIEKEENSDGCPLCEAKLRLIFHYGLYGYVPPPETAVELFEDPEGWHIVESKKFESNYAKEEKNEFAINRELFRANKGFHN